MSGHLPMSSNAGDRNLRVDLRDSIKETGRPFGLACYLNVQDIGKRLGVR